MFAVSSWPIPPLPRPLEEWQENPGAGGAEAFPKLATVATCLHLSKRGSRAHGRCFSWSGASANWVCHPEITANHMCDSGAALHAAPHTQEGHTC